MTRSGRRTRYNCVTRLLAAAALGVLSTYAIAFGAVFLGQRTGASLGVASNTFFNASGREYWAQRFVASGFERIDVTPLRGQSILTRVPAPMFEALSPTVDSIDVASLGALTDASRHRPGLTVQFHRAGWPCPTVQAVTGHTWTGTTPKIASVAGGWAIFGEPALIATSAQPAILPFQPLWREFILVSGVSSVAWGLFATLGPFAVRRWLRVRRGLCAECGYPVSDNLPNVVCSECGMAPR